MQLCATVCTIVVRTIIICGVIVVVIFFFFNDTATTEIYTLSLHDALPILTSHPVCRVLSLAVVICPE